MSATARRGSVASASGESGSSGEGSGGEAGAEEQGGSEGSQQGSDQADGQAAEGSDAGGAAAGENGVVGERASALLSDERGSAGGNNGAEDGASLLSANEASTLAELKSAISSAPDGSTIQLKADIAIDSQVSMGMATAKSLTIDGSGAPTALYYLPNALLREFIALVVMRKKRFIVVVVIVFLLTATSYGLPYYLAQMISSTL